MRAIPVAVTLLASATPGLASGGLSCEAQGKGAQITIESGVTRGMGAPVFNFRGRSEFASRKVEADLGRLDFTEANLAQYWLDGKELRLILYREREGDRPHGYVEITILTKAVEEGSYAGTYELTAFDMTGSGGGEARQLELNGKISCFAE